MKNHSNSGGETIPVAIVIGLAGIVGLLLLVQLIRGQAPDLISMLFISVCFVIAVIVTAMWSKRSKA